MNQKYNKMIEKIVFFAMISGMSVAGYAYEIYKDTVSKVFLITFIVLYFVVLYLLYRITIYFLIKR